jgi:cold shock CspA family protein
MSKTLLASFLTAVAYKCAEGFIQPQGGGKDVFVHISAVERAGLSGLNERRVVLILANYADHRRDNQEPSANR